MTQQEMQAEINRLKAENETLKASKAPKVGMKVSPKGGVSVYGLGRFPVTLYRTQWEALIERVPAIQKFITDNASKLASKE